MPRTDTRFEARPAGIIQKEGTAVRCVLVLDRSEEEPEPPGRHLARVVPTGGRRTVQFVGAHSCKDEDCAVGTVSVSVCYPIRAVQTLVAS